MTVETKVGVPMDAVVLQKYFQYLVNRFFKILPLKEEGDAVSASLQAYLESFQRELAGCHSFVVALRHDGDLATLLFILEDLINNPQCEIYVVKREVFRAISICKRLESKYSPKEVDVS